MSAAALLVGGIAPAILLGVSTVLIRFSSDAGASIPLFLVVVGATIAATGGLALLVGGEIAGGGKAILFTIAMGLSWAAAVACMSYGFGVLKLPVAFIAPLSNSSALVAVLMGAWFFGEWHNLNPTYVLGGAALICAGATLVSLAK
jgi:transporter family protein